MTPNIYKIILYQSFFKNRTFSNEVNKKKTIKRFLILGWTILYNILIGSIIISLFYILSLTELYSFNFLTGTQGVVYGAIWGATCGQIYFFVNSLNINLDEEDDDNDIRSISNGIAVGAISGIIFGVSLGFSDTILLNYMYYGLIFMFVLLFISERSKQNWIVSISLLPFVLIFPLIIFISKFDVIGLFPYGILMGVSIGIITALNINNKNTMKDVAENIGYILGWSILLAIIVAIIVAFIPNREGLTTGYVFLMLLFWSYCYSHFLITSRFFYVRLYQNLNNNRHPLRNEETFIRDIPFFHKKLLSNAKKDLKSTIDIIENVIENRPILLDGVQKGLVLITVDIATNFKQISDIKLFLDKTYYLEINKKSICESFYDIIQFFTMISEDIIEADNNKKKDILHTKCLYKKCIRSLILLKNINTKNYAAHEFSKVAEIWLKIIQNEYKYLHNKLT